MYNWLFITKPFWPLTVNYKEIYIFKDVLLIPYRAPAEIGRVGPGPPWPVKFSFFDHTNGPKRPIFRFDPHIWWKLPLEPPLEIFLPALLIPYSTVIASFAFNVSDPCNIIPTWLGYDYETLAVNSENETIAIVYTCPDRTQFSDGSKTKYASCDVTAFWSPEIQECERKECSRAVSSPKAGEGLNFFCYLSSLTFLQN